MKKDMSIITHVSWSNSIIERVRVLTVSRKLCKCRLVPKHSNIQMRKVTHTKVEVFVCEVTIGTEIRVHGTEGVVCEGGQAEDGDGKNLESAIRGGQNMKGVTVCTTWQIRMIATQRGIAGIFSTKARPPRIFELS
jgi:hypothetical protein